MGDMADMALDMIDQFEALADDYVSGEMSCEEAMEHGFIDGMGNELPGVQDAWDRSVLGGATTINKELQHAVTEFDAQSFHAGVKCNGEPIRRTTTCQLNTEAVGNLSKDVPTCNVCRKAMQPRTGKFGKFYFCKCPEQVTVSDAYWQSIRK